MSSVAQERMAKGLTILMAVAVATCLLLVGWTLYRPGPAPAPAPVAADR